MTSLFDIGIGEAAMEDNTTYSVPRAGQRFPAIVGLQGKRLATFTTQIRPTDFEVVLGHDPRSRNRNHLRDERIKKLYSFIQRKTTAERSRDILKYCEERIFQAHPIAGAVPAVSIAVEQPVAFERFGNHSSLGEMLLETGTHNLRVVLDGLGRITGLMDIVDLVRTQAIEPEARAVLQKQLEMCALPVVFFAPQLGQPSLTEDEIGQLFCDFNFKVRPVSIKDAMALDHSDPYIELTRYLHQHSRAIKDFGGMETKRASLGSKSTGIVVQPVLLRFVRGALEGEAYLEAARNAAVEVPNFSAERADEIKRSLVDFMDHLAESMGPRWSERGSMHLSSPGWQVIGLLYHDMAFRLRKGQEEMVNFALALSRLDWRREGDVFGQFMTTKTGNDGSEQLALNSAGASVRRELLKNLRARLGIAEQLASQAKD
jgi:DNA-sulfur modification-associated